MPSKPAPRARPASKQPPAAPAKLPPRWLRPLILVLGAVFLIALLSRPFMDSDAWWQLKTGQYIVQNHQLPVPDPFSFTTARSRTAYPGEEQIRRFNLTHEWLAQAALYLAWAAGGFGGVVLLRVILLSAFCILIGLTARARGAGFYGFVFAALAAAVIVRVNAVDRPQLFTYAFVALTLYVLECRRWLWLLPPVFLFWANAHGGFVMGWILLAAYGAEALVQRWRGKPAPKDRRLWLVAAICAAVTVLNPNGWRVFQVLAAYRQSALQATLYEWQRTNYWELSPFTVVFYAAILTLLWARGKARLVDWLLFPLFAAAALSAVRNIFLVALVAPVIIASYFPWKRTLPVAAEFAVALLLAAAAIAHPFNPTPFQFRADESEFPKGAADFLVAHHITGPMFNTYVQGGYLIWRLWPQERVFTDGRALSETAFQDSNRIAGNADSTGGRSGDELLADYGIQVIVMNGFEFHGGKAYYLPAALSDPSQKEWKLVFQDDAAMVFMRHPPPDVQPLNSLDALVSMENECAAHIRSTPQENGCAAELGRLFSIIGDPVRARKWAR